MVAHVSGKVIAVADGLIIIDMGALALQVQVPSVTAYVISETVTVQTYLHWNTETGPSLFGFATDVEKRVFGALISCSGIGPKMALSILASLSPQMLVSAVQDGDEKALSSISGIGPKKAEQIIVQLRHKITKLLDSGMIIDQESGLSVENWKHVTQVLQSLNYSKGEIDVALNHLKQEKQSDASFDLLVRKALGFLAKRV